MNDEILNERSLEDIINDRVALGSELSTPIDREIYRIKGVWMDDIERTNYGFYPEVVVSGTTTPTSPSTLTLSDDSAQPVSTKSNVMYFKDGAKVKFTIKTPTALRNFFEYDPNVEGVEKTNKVTVTIDGKDYNLGILEKEVASTTTPGTIEYESLPLEFTMTSDHRITIHWKHNVYMEIFRFSVYR